MDEKVLTSVLDRALQAVQESVKDGAARPRLEEAGWVVSIKEGITRLRGLPSARAEELLLFEEGALGMALNLDEDGVGVIMLDESSGLAAGSRVRTTGRVLDVPVGDELLGRVIDPMGRPRDGKGSITATRRMQVERDAPPIMDRAPVRVPLQTGIKAVDALIPIGRGQRELIIGDRQTGKTAIAVDTIVNQKGKGIFCVYCAIGKRKSAVARVVDDLRTGGALSHSIIVTASGDDPPGMQYVAPYAAMTMAEFFRDNGADALVVFDDLTNHARSYRELSLLLRRPPGREAYPGDIFYIHSRLLERSTQLAPEKGGGSLTALPIAETEAQNLSAYIPTNLISITDGQVYLSPTLFSKGILPAVDIGRSVSRVGGKTQLPAYREVAGDLRLSYSQFQELEAFSRFGTRLEEETRKTLEHGRRIREILKQDQYDRMNVSEQVAVLLAATEGVFDDFPVEKVREGEDAVRKAVREGSHGIFERIEAGEKLSGEDRLELSGIVSGAVKAAG